MDLNTIKNTANWGTSTSRLNENFTKVGTEVDKLKYAAYNSKLYATEALLKQAVPSPKLGDWAIVGDTIPGEIYQCKTDGVWTATGQTGGGYGMEVVEKNVTEQHITEVHNEYTGDIINNPDDEDLYSEEVSEGKSVLKLADKAYNASSFSGMGRAYLRKNITGGKNVLTQAMMGKANTRYVIQYDYDLNGETVTVPEGCTLDFQGGSLKNGTLVGNFQMVHPNFSNVDLDNKYTMASVLSGYGCYVESIEGDMNAAKDIHDLGFSYVIYYCYEMHNSEQIKRALANIRLFDFYGVAVILYIDTSTSEDVVAIASNFSNEPNLVGWYVYDEPVAHGKSISQQESKMASLREAKNLPCFVAENVDYYINTGPLSNKYDYVFISQYYNILYKNEIIDDFGALSAYGRLNSYSGYGMDRLLPIYETYDENENDSKLLNNLLVKKRLYKHKGAFFIYSASNTIPSLKGLKNSKSLRQVAKTVMSAPVEQGNMVIRGFCINEMNAFKKVPEVLSDKGRFKLQFGPDQLPNEKGLFLYSNKEYLLIDFGKRVSSCRLAFGWIDANGPNKSHTFDICIPLTDELCIKLESWEIITPSNSAYIDGVKNVIDINSNKLLICSTKESNGYKLFRGINAVGIYYKEEENVELDNIQSYGIPEKGTTAERPELNHYDAGTLFFDSTLGKYILFSGIWKNVDGTDL